ncbi:hypothetical protein CRUP_000355 [Coryphaenoides rupestris]|nr:hypothetical protein CRUP_000355 [Coryphaenoides rupestris]
MRRKIESTVAGISTKIRSFSEERKVSDEKEQKRTPIFSMLRRATSENRGVKSVAVPSNQLAAQTSNGASSESLDSMSSLKSEMSKDFAPLFHIKLRDHVLLEGDPVTLSCLPAGSPHPHIAWVKVLGLAWRHLQRVAKVTKSDLITVVHSLQQLSDTGAHLEPRTH